MKIGLVVHGPEVIDSGGCAHILNLLQNHIIIGHLQPPQTTQTTLKLVVHRV